MKLSEEVINKFNIKPEELKGLEQLKQNQLNFVLGLKQLIKETGVTVISNDYDDVYLTFVSCDIAFGSIIADGTSDAIFSIFSK